MTPLINASVGMMGFALTFCALSLITSVNVIPSILSNWYGDNKRPRVDVTVTDSPVVGFTTLGLVALA